MLAHSSAEAAKPMIVITVQSFNGQPVAGLAATFNELGGNIGRADTNQLVLPDPERSVSRVHAQVVFRNGGYMLVDRGSNAVLVNDQPVGHGREVPLRDGDTLSIGGYVLRASLAAAAGGGFAAPPVGAAAVTDPFADPFADPFGAPAGGQAGSPAPAWPGAGSAARALFGDAPAAPLSPPAPPSPATWPAPPVAGGGPAATLPDDWDPFAPPAAAPMPAAAAWSPGAAVGAPPSSMAPPSRADSLDQLFDLGFAPSADPFAATPAALPRAQPNTLADKDPLRAFGMDAAPVPAALPDHLSDLHTPWQSPSLTPAQAAPPVPATPQGAVLSWQQPSRDGKLVTLPGQPRAAAVPVDPLGLPDMPGVTTIAPVARRDAAARPATPAIAPSMPAAPPAPAMPPAAAQVDAWRQALADGLGMPAERLGPLTPEQLHLIGQLLRSATAGVVELLVARAELKRAMRTDVTMIGATENNALKFSPHVDVALNHLLGPPMTGFMPPARAMRDAFDDLRAHQMGVMAGMQAALDGVLARFEPAQLETKIAARRTALAALMPSTRKAQLWEQFQQLYAQLSAEATDDFQALFGKAFAKAYQAHVQAMQDDSI